MGCRHADDYDCEVMRLKSPYKGRFKVTQVFKGTPHRGIDLVGLDDKTIHSTVNGVVEASRYDTHPTGGMGLYVRVRENATNRRHYFAHLKATFTSSRGKR